MPEWTFEEFVVLLQHHVMTDEDLSAHLSQGVHARTVGAVRAVREGACAWHSRMSRSYETLMNAACKEYLRRTDRPEFHCWKPGCQEAPI